MGQFLNFIQTVLQLKSIDVTGVFNLVSESDFTPSQICDYCIELFVQLNFTGPVNSETESLVQAPEDILKFISDDLTCEGEVPFRKTKGLILLWIGKNIAEKIRKASNTKHVYKSCIAYLKCIYMQQATIPDQRSILLKTQMEECFKQADQIKSDDTDGFIDAMDEFELAMIASYLHQLYYEYQQADDLLEKCKALLGLSMELKGALGKRTKFQQTEISQMYVEMRRENVDSAQFIESVLEPERSTQLPNDHMIDDEILLDETSFTDSTIVTGSVTLAEQAVLALTAQLHKSNRAKDEATMEECSTLLCRALGAGAARRSTWAIASDALMQRCMLGTKSSRRTERALMQLEELSSQFSQSIPPASQRSNRFFLARMPSIWELQLRLASILMSMGMTKSALDILLPWDQWDAIIRCLITLDERGRAERLIRERLAADGDSAELLCCLGDVTKEREHYERAWDVSKHKSARAMRSLAMHYMFVDMDHKRACECFEASLSINPLQVNTWFTYGCCCLQQKSYRPAVAAFKQCVRLEPDNFEAWNNCASALIELGEKKNALVLLKEATKYSFDNWRVWDNICMVATDIAEYGVAMNAYHRIMDIGRQHRDPVVLHKMVQAAGKAELDEKLLMKLRELFARIASKDGRDPRIWTIYADLVALDIDQGVEARQKVIQCLSRAHHGFCAAPGWQLDAAQRRRALVSCMRLVSKSIELDVGFSSAKLAIKSVLAVLEQWRQTHCIPDNEGTEQSDEESLALLEELDHAYSVLETKQ